MAIDASGPSMLYLQQYLKTAAPHVFVEYASDVNRFRFCCSKCQNTLTFSDGFGVENENVQWQLQEFVKNHLHKSEELKNAQEKFQEAKEEAEIKRMRLNKLADLEEQMRFTAVGMLVDKIQEGRKIRS